ncbi:hypothetical protein FJY94_06950 [Candidatus Kaiserbacteria bacterium]|nr:hypothetical protein [Candidatus Kaiserbacteria bacterium]
MTLSALIRKRDTGNLATAIPAIPAIPAAQPKWSAEPVVARIAKVAVADLTEAKPATPAPIVSPRDTAADFDREWFEERAAIYEFDAGFPRHEAERLAMEEIAKWQTLSVWPTLQ